MKPLMLIMHASPFKLSEPDFILTPIITLVLEILAFKFLNY